jgi:hypothetical protein
VQPTVSGPEFDAGTLLAMCQAGSAPAGTGGTIDNGTYYLDSAAIYATDCTGVTSPTLGATVVVSGTTLQIALSMGGVDSSFTATLPATGDGLTTTCGSLPGATYTAAATTLTLSLPESYGTLVLSIGEPI